MMTFLLSAGAMIIVLLLIICIPLLTFRKKDTGAEELPQANIAIYRDQFKELEDELAAVLFLRTNMTKADLSSSAVLLKSPFRKNRLNRPVKRPVFTRFLFWFWSFLSLLSPCGLPLSISVTSVWTAAPMKAWSITTPARSSDRPAKCTTWILP